MTDRPLNRLPIRLLVLLATLSLSVSACAQAVTANTSQQLAFAGLVSAAHQGRGNAVRVDQAGNIFLLLDEGDGIRLEKTDNNGGAMLAQAHLGAAGDSGLALALDPAGNVFVTGTTTSSALTGTSGAAIPSRTDSSTNSFVAKFDTNLNLLFLTFTGGSRIAASAIAASADSVFVTGLLYGTNLPVTANGVQQAPAYQSSQNGFVERFSADGTTLLYATYLTGAAGSTTPAGIAVDASDDAFIVGQTTATGYPTVAALVPAMLSNPSGFLTRLTPAGDGITASTFVPGPGLTGIAVDSTGQTLLVSGSVALGQFPVDTVATPLIPTTYQTLLRLPLDLSAVASGTLIAPGMQSSVAAAAQGAAWIDGALSAPLLPIPALSTIGNGFAAEVTNTGNPYPYQVTQTVRLGGVPLESLSYASLPLSLDSIAVDSAGDALFAGTLQPTASSSLLATETYDLPLGNSPTSALPATVRSSETNAASCTGSLCAGSAAYLAKLAPASAAALTFAVDDAPFLTLRNLGSSTANALALTVSTGSFTTSCGQTLPPGAECALLLSGAAAGSVTASYTYGTAATPTSETAPFPALDAPRTTIDLLPKELDFGIVSGAGAGVATRTLTIANLGSAPQTFTSAIDLPPKSTTQFSETSSDCPTSASAQTKLLAAGAICHITLAFTAFPSSANDGAASGQWTIGTRDVALSAQSQAAAISLSAPEINFGTQYTGGLRLPRFLYLSNSSSAAQSHAPLSQPAGSAFTVADHCPLSLPAASVCQIRIDYQSAATPSVDSTMLTLDQGVSVLVTGKTLPQPGVAGATVNPDLSVTPASVTFPTAVVVTSVSASAQSISIMNSGSSAFSLNLALTGDFSDLTSCGATLAAGATCAVQVRFTPSQPGARNGLLAITAGSGFAPLYVPLTGTANAILPTSNGTIDFGSTVVGEPLTQFLKLAQPFTALTVQAAGAYTVALIEDTGFGVGNPPANSFAANFTGSCQNCYLAIRFLPMTAGPQPGTLTLSSAAAGIPYQLALTGIGTPASGLLLTPVAASFGNVPVHSSSAPVLFTATNQLSAPATVTLTGLTVSGDFSTATVPTGAPGCAGSLAPGASCEVAVIFAPSTSGTRAGTLSLTSSAGNVTASLSGQGLADPGIALNPTALIFNDVPGQTATVQTVTVTNTSPYAAMIGSLSATSTSFQAGSNCGTLNPGGSCTLTVTYTPGGAITSGSLSVPFTVNGQLSTYTIAVSGNYTASSAGLQFFPAQASFGPVPTSAVGPTLVYTLSNLTGKTFTLSTTFPRNYLPAGPPCTALAPNASCSFQVTFDPLTSGALPGSIIARATPTDGTGMLTAIAYGEGYGQGQGSLTLSGGLIANQVYSFGQVASGQTATQVFTLTNSAPAGSAPVTVRRVTSLPPFLSMTTCGTALAPGQTCSVTVTYTPSNQVATGITAPPPTTDTGLLTLESDALDSPQLLNLTGQGGAVSVSNPVNPTSLASYTLSESALSFPQTTVGNVSTAQTVTLMNSGTNTLHVSSVTVSSDFTASTTCASVTPGGSCTISVESTPQTAGTKVSAVQIASNAANSLDYVSLMTVAGASPLTISPASLNFGSVQVGMGSTLGVQVTNTSTAPVLFASITATKSYTAGGTCQELAAAGTALTPNATCNVQVTFQPSAAGAVPGTLSVSSSASSLPLTLALTGSGLESNLVVSPAALAFGSIVVGSPANLSVTLSNTGSAPVTGLALAATGDFTVTLPCPTLTLAPGATCTAQITFTPSAGGARTGLLTVLSSDPSSPLTVPLSGTGIQSGSFTLLVNGAASANVTVVSGQPAAYTLSLSPTSGFSGEVALTCTAITAAQYASCSLNPASLALTSAPLFGAATINTITSSGGNAARSSRPLEPLANVLLCLLFPGLLSVWRSRKTLPQRLPVLAALFMTTLTLMIIGCGGGGSSSDPNVRYTPPGTYQYQVTASSTSGVPVSQTVTLNLTVTAR